MDISLNSKYGYELIFITDNVKVVEDIEERIYTLKEDGKIDYSIHPKRDIKTESIDQFSNLLNDIIYYRKKEFDSSDLIKSLFKKLPEKKINDLILELKRIYE